jgi:hypothetical protein
MLVNRLQCRMCQEAKQFGKEPKKKRRSGTSFIVAIFESQQQMRLLLYNEFKGGNAINTLLPLLILGKGVVSEQPFQACFSDDTDEGDKLWIRLIGIWMLKKFLYQLSKSYSVCGVMLGMYG